MYASSQRAILISEGTSAVIIDELKKNHSLINFQEITHVSIGYIYFFLAYIK